MNTRVFLVDVPRLMREIIETAVARRPDVFIVGEAHDTNRVIDEIRGARADIVVLDVGPPGRPDVLVPLLEQLPAMPLLLISQDGRAVFRCQPLGELSLPALLRSLEQP